jgi:hypothetical protein
MARVERVEKVEFFLWGVDSGGRLPIADRRAHAGNSAYPTYLLYPADFHRKAAGPGPGRPTACTERPPVRQRKRGLLLVDLPLWDDL